MLDDASAEKKKLDSARVMYQQRARIRDHIQSELNRLKSLIEKYRILAQDPDTAKVRVTSRAVAPIRPD